MRQNWYDKALFIVAAIFNLSSAAILTRGVPHVGEIADAGAVDGHIDFLAGSWRCAESRGHVEQA